MSQDMPEKLELIAKCLREGREIQCLGDNGEWFLSSNNSGTVSVYDEEMEYRAKPEKPRYGYLIPYGEGEKLGPRCISAVEITPEVSKALEDAGIEI